MDGADNGMSLTKRTTVPALRALPYSASQVPASTPSGADTDGQCTHHGTAEEGVGEVAVLHRRWRHLGEQIPVDAGQNWQPG